MRHANVITGIRDVIRPTPLGPSILEPRLNLGMDGKGNVTLNPESTFALSLRMQHSLGDR